MLTLGQCRKTDPRLRDLSDEELTQVRDDAYHLVRIVFSVMQNGQSSKSPDRYLQDST